MWKSVFKNIPAVIQQKPYIVIQASVKYNQTGKKDNKFKITEKNLIILSATIIIIISLIAVSAFYIFNQPEPTGTYNYNFDGYNFNIPNGYQKSDYTSSFGYGDDAFFDGSDGSIYISVSKNSLTSAEDFTNNAKNSYNLNFTQGNINNINGYLSKTGLTGRALTRRWPECPGTSIS